MLGTLSDALCLILLLLGRAVALIAYEQCSNSSMCALLWAKLKYVLMLFI